MIVSKNGSRVLLPSGTVVEGMPHASDDYRATAQRLGYGDDALEMCLDHDALHALLCSWLGLPTSYSLSYAAGELDESLIWLTSLEEDAVMAVQRFARLARERGKVRPEEEDSGKR